jgi:aspartate dehydrogenase
MIRGSKRLRLGIIGYGSIGRDVARRVKEGAVPGVELTRILVRQWRAGFDPHLFTDDFSTFIRDVDLVVEAAGQEAVRRYGLAVIRHGVSLVIVSVGALSDPNLVDEFRHEAAAARVRVYCPSCAIAGLDRIAAAREGTLSRVRLITRKPVKAWYGTIAEQQYDLSSLSEKVLLYAGSARDAAVQFPESLNVSASLALAGLGMDRTEVEVWIDPSLTTNVHEVYAEGDFGRFYCEVRNRPSVNPRTGVIVAMSIIKLLRNLMDPFVIGV